MNSLKDDIMREINQYLQEKEGKKWKRIRKRG